MGKEIFEGPSRIPTQWRTEAPVPVSWMRQFEYFLHLYERIRDVPGDIVECGLGEGNTFAMLAHMIGNRGQDSGRTLWGFDSFEGWPEPSPYDASPRNPQKGEWQTNEEMVVRRLKESKIYEQFPNLSIRIVKGFVGQTLPNFPRDRKIAFTHLDLDLYEGYRDALEYLFPLVSSRGIVAFDEYKEFPNRSEYEYGQIEKWPGCTKAVDEYFANRPEKVEYYPNTKKYFVVKSAA